MVLKKLLKYAFFALIVLNMITYRSCVNRGDKLKASESRIEQILFTNDSLLNIPPDTVKTQIETIKDSIIYVNKWHKPIPKTAKLFKDSLINDSIDVRVSIYADNIYSINYAYRPIYKYQEKIITKYVPKEITREVEKEIAQRGLFISGGIGYGVDPAVSLGLMYLNKKGYVAGVQAMRYGTNNIYTLNFGIKL